MADQDFTVRFWGTRGSIPCASPDYMQYGGHTSCLEVMCGDFQLILDGGTGIRMLADVLMQGAPKPLTILLSHTHFDHVMGLPFFMPLYTKGWDIRFFAGHLAPEDTLKNVFQKMMVSPFFPISPDAFKASLSYTDFTPGTVLNLHPGVVVRTLALPHPDRATGYRIEFGGKAFCYITDIEHKAGTLNQDLVAFLRGADAVAYDCTFTDAEYKAHVGWGHSTWEEGLRLVHAAGAKKLVIFHHNPNRDDAGMAGVEAAAKAADAATIVSRDGMLLTV
ncbi:MAG: MBL fold metallo-hydrolase [Holosporales bacterium]